MSSHKNKKQLYSERMARAAARKYAGSRQVGGDADAGAGPLVPSVTLPARSLLGVAQSLKRTLVHVNDATFNVSNQTYAEATFTLNGAYQPDGATSPDGYAKYMALYSKCFVLAARIIWKGSYVQSVTGAAKAGIAITTNSTSLASSTAAINNGLGKWSTFYNNPDRLNINMGVDVRKFLHKPFVLDDPQLFSTASANPTQVIVAHLWVQGYGGTMTASFNSTIEILLDVVFTDPIPFT